MTLFGAFACTAAGVASLVIGGDDTALWFMLGAVWFHLADREKGQR